MLFAPPSRQNPRFNPAIPVDSHNRTDEAIRLNHRIPFLTQLIDNQTIKHTIQHLNKVPEKYDNRKNRAFSALFYHQLSPKSTKTRQKAVPNPTNLHFYKQRSPIRNESRQPHKPVQPTQRKSILRMDSAPSHRSPPDKSRRNEIRHPPQHTSCEQTQARQIEQRITALPVLHQKDFSQSGLHLKKAPPPHPSHTPQRHQSHLQKRQKEPGHTTLSIGEGSTPRFRATENGYRLHAVNEG